MQNTSKIALTLATLAVFSLVLAGCNRDEIKPDTNLYQVVLLNNDQVFFGKLHNADDRNPYLTDVYYLKQEEAKTDQKGKLVQPAQPSFRVIKRGFEELHSPTDQMHLNSDSIVYWENVGAESLMAKGIAADIADRAKRAQATPAPTPVPAPVK
ncbi:hypothetical protein KBD59_01915 [Candidatus Gracilibacteria bacterium]|nr:hypothetical protein [Candidatus Gracilibacteria bacterium]